MGNYFFGARSIIMGCATPEPPQKIVNVGELETYLNNVAASGTLKECRS